MCVCVGGGEGNEHKNARNEQQKKIEGKQKKKNSGGKTAFRRGSGREIGSPDLHTKQKKNGQRRSRRRHTQSAGNEAHMRTQVGVFTRTGTRRVSQRERHNEKNTTKKRGHKERAA